MESKSFAELFEESLNENQARPGTIVSARVVAINDDYVILDAGLNSESSVPIEQFKNAAGELEIAVGDDVPVVLESIESGDGETVLSREKAKRNEAWAKIEEAFKNEESVTGIIEGKIKGGYTVQLGAIRAFLPSSLVDVRPVHDASYLEGKELQFKVIKLDQKRNNVVVSRRAVIETETATERANILANLQEGQIIDGIVKNLTDYGAFVDLGGVDGLLHIRDMSWERVTNPSAIVNIGDEIKVKVLKFDRERQRITLGLKQLHNNPWSTAAERYQIGSKHEGTVTNILDFGCFVKLKEGIEGLVHQSNMDWINDEIPPSKVVSVGEKITVQVLYINPERERIGLGIKQCRPNPWTELQQGARVTGQITATNEQGLKFTLANGIEGFARFDQIEWTSASNSNADNKATARVLDVNPEYRLLALSLDVATLCSYLSQLTDQSELNLALEHIAQSLGLVATSADPSESSTHHTNPALGLKRFLGLLEALDAQQTEAIFDQSWMHAALKYADTTDLLRSCLTLAPAKSLAQSLEQYEPLLAEFAHSTNAELMAYRPKLQALLEQLLYGNSMLEQPRNLVLKLLVLNLYLEPKLYDNLITHGSINGNIQTSGTAVDHICSNLRTLIRHEQLGHGEYQGLGQAQIPHLIALLIQAHSHNDQVLSWAQPWLNDSQIQPEIAHELELLLQPTANTAPQLLKLDGTNPKSLELIAQLPRKLRLAHTEAFMGGPLWDDFVAHELSPIIAPITKSINANWINNCFELLGLTVSESSSVQIKWPQDIDAKLATQVLALCCALNDAKVSAHFPYITTAIVGHASKELSIALIMLKKSQWSLLLRQYQSYLYQSTAVQEHPWATPLALSLVNRLGCALKQLSSTLSNYIVVGPTAFSAALAQITPLLPLSSFNTYYAAFATNQDDEPKDREAILAALASSDGLQVPADTESLWDGWYLNYSNLAQIKDDAPVLYELLQAHLQGAPEFIALKAIPEGIKAQLCAAQAQQASSFLDEADLNAFISLVVTPTELAANGQAINYCGSLDDLSALAPSQLKDYSLLMVGQDPSVLLESLEPKPLRLNLTPNHYFQFGAQNILMTLSNFKAQLNVIMPPISSDLVQWHIEHMGAEVDPKTQDNCCVIMSRKLDGTFNLYTLGHGANQQLAAFKSCEMISTQLWPSSVPNQAISGDAQPLKISFVSTNQAPTYHAPFMMEHQPELRPLLRTLEQDLNINNGLEDRAALSWQKNLRIKYFAYQLYLLKQLQAQSTSPICYVIEYEDDIRPLCSYFKEYQPELFQRLHLISLSTLLPQSLCSDVVNLQQAQQAQQALLQLPPDSILVINSLEFDAHQDLTNQAIALQNSLSVRHTLMELGLSTAATNLDSEQLLQLKDQLKAISDVGKQTGILTLLQGLLALIYLKLGAVSRTFSYYLLEPNLNDGLDAATASFFSASFSLEPLFLKPFATSQDQELYQEQLKPYYGGRSKLQPIQPKSAASAQLRSTQEPIAVPLTPAQDDRSIDQAKTPFDEFDEEPEDQYEVGLLQEVAPQVIPTDDLTSEVTPSQLDNTERTADSYDQIDVPWDDGEADDNWNEAAIEEAEPTLAEQPEEESASQQAITMLRSLLGIYNHNATNPQALELLTRDDEQGKQALQQALDAISDMFINGHEWRPDQKIALPAILTHQTDALISLPTGGGKSVLFQGPAWYRAQFSGRLTIVITPLKALMLDQVKALRDKSYLSVDYLSSDRPFYEMRQAMKRLKSGETTLLYITPERLRSRYFVETLKRRYEQDDRKGEYFVFDEAHCISQWGKEFRPDYIHAAKFVADLRQTYDFCTIMCSATMTSQVVTDLVQYLRPNCHKLGEFGPNYNPIRPHITLLTEPVPADKPLSNTERVAAIIQYIRKHHVNFDLSRLLVFCQTRNSTQSLYALLESYAQHLRRLYNYQQQHPEHKFEPMQLTVVLQKLPPYQISANDDSNDDFGLLAEPTLQDEDSLAQMPSEGEEQAELFAQDSPWEQQLGAALSTNSSNVNPANSDQELLCDLDVIDPHDPILKLSQHMGYFHAGMSARTREHIFNRYKAKTDRELINTNIRNNNSWFNDNFAFDESSETSLEQTLVNNEKPLFVLFATKAFGMGMDIPNIHYVLHATPTAVFEDYMQEVGRAGRSQEMYEAAFPVDTLNGERGKLPANCLYNDEDFEKAKDRVNKSLIGWPKIVLADELIREYVQLYSTLNEAIVKPVVVPAHIFELAIVVSQSSEDYAESNDLNSNDTSSMLFYYLEEFGRIKLGFRAPCPITLTLQREPFMQMWQHSDVGSSATTPWLNFAYNPELQAGPSERIFEHSVIIAQKQVMIALERMLRRYDEKHPEQDALVKLHFDLQNFLQQSNNNMFNTQRINTTATINALIELMAAGLITLKLPFRINFPQCDPYSKTGQKRSEAEYYLERYKYDIPAISSTALPILTISLRVCVLILEQSYEDFCAEVKRRRENGQLERDDINKSSNSVSNPLPDYHGIAITKQWIQDKVKEMAEPLADKFDPDNSGYHIIPWLPIPKSNPKKGQPPKNSLEDYINQILIPAVSDGISSLLQQLPNVKITKRGKGTKQQGQMVKTWSDDFYLMLDLLYEDSWHLLALIYQQNHQASAAPQITLNSLNHAADAQTAPSNAPQASLNDWGEIVFKLGLRHESCSMVMDNYELNWSRNNAQQLFYEASNSLDTFNYFGNLLTFLKSLRLIEHSALTLNGYELNLTEESAELPMDNNGYNTDSPFYSRYKKLDEINQFKLLRVSVMETYCKFVPNEQRNNFITEFFNSKENSDLIKNIEEYVPEDSKILKEITAARLDEEEKKLQANPEQWAVYQSPLDQSLNVMAGPGSGKTHVLALRCVRMIYRDKVAPDSILILAYNRAVVVELKTRIDQIFTNLGLRKVGRKVPIFTFHGLAKYCLGDELNNVEPEDWEHTIIAKLRAQPQLFVQRFANLRYIMIDEFQDITHARLDLLILLKRQYGKLTLFTIGDINQSIYGFDRIKNIVRDPEQKAQLQDDKISPHDYANGLGPEPYYQTLEDWFKPTTMSLSRNYRSFPEILKKAAPLAFNQQYVSQSAPHIIKYAPQNQRYSDIFDVTTAAYYRAQQQQRKFRHWTEDLQKILKFVTAQNETMAAQEQEAALALGKRDPGALASYIKLILTQAAINAAQSKEALPTRDSTDSDALAPSASSDDAVATTSPSEHEISSNDEKILESHFHRVDSIALFFRTNNEVYRALEQVRALPQEIIAQIDVRVQSSNRTSLWLEREFYAIAHFIKSMGTQRINLNSSLLQQGPTEDNDDDDKLNELIRYDEQELRYCLQEIAQDDAQSALRLLTKVLMLRYEVWDRLNLDMAYCSALSFSSTMSSTQLYTWADLYEYYCDLLSRDDGGQCYKLYESMWHHHLEHQQKRISLVLSTIHKVKGLEYDMVIIPPSTANLPISTHDYIRPEPHQVRFDRDNYATPLEAQQQAQQIPLSEDELADIAEERRLYYVAYTRARKYLYVYSGDRERALQCDQRYVSSDSQIMWGEKDDSLDYYVLSFNANQNQAGTDDYIASKVKPHDPVVILTRGNKCFIWHYADPAQPQGKCIGMLSKNSNISRQMQRQGVSRLEGLFISNIIVCTYDDTIKSDIKRVQDAMANPRNQNSGYRSINSNGYSDFDLTNDQIRAAAAREYHVSLFAPYWSQAAINKGYCYLVVLAGRGRPSQSGPEQQRSLPPATRQTWPQQQVAPRPITRPVHANNWNRYRDNGRPNTARTPEDLLKDYSIY